MFNRVILVGNLTRDIELRYMPSGSAICSTGIATNRRFKKNDGSMGEEVCFIDISIVGQMANVANQYLKKGSKVLIEGRLRLDSWTDQNGQKRSKHTVFVTNLQMLGSRGEKTDGNYQDDDFQKSNAAQNQNAAKQNIPEIDIDEDEIPF